MGQVRQCGFSACVLSLLCAVIAIPAHAETRVLLVGVWKFHSADIPDLKGPENDLAAMEALMRQQGATDVTVFDNDQVTRTSVETALHALGLRSKPGDWILVYYSGHGAQAEAAVKGTADGDLDQFLPLAGFDPDKQDPERFIVDKDFYNWMARYIPRAVQVLMIADVCHSGTLNRSIDPRAFRFTPRVAFRGDIAEFSLTSRPAPQFPGVLGAEETIDGGSLIRADLPNVIYIGAALDDQFALEAPLPVEGAPSRGLLTYSFEQGLTSRGANQKTAAADLDGDAKVTMDEIAAYLDSQVRALTSQRQEPSAHIPTGRGSQVLFGTVATARPGKPLAPGVATLPAMFAPEKAVLAQLSAPDFPWRTAPDSAHADFVWDSAQGVVLRRSGDAVATGVTTISALRGVVEKWNAVDQLRPLLSERSVILEIGPRPSGARYPAGAKVSVTVRRPVPARGDRAEYLTLFGIASDGTVQTLYPLVVDGAGLLGANGATPEIDNVVIPPFGADHLIAVVTPTEPVAFRALVRSVDNQRAAGRLVGPIRDALTAAAGRGALSIGELYSGN